MKLAGDQLSEAAPRSRSGASSAKAARSLKGDLDNILLKALRKEPERRYVSVEQFAEDVRRHLQGLPVTATPDSITYRVSKLVRRHKAGMAGTALIVLAILAGVVATVRESRIAASNQRRAERRFNDVRRLANSLMFEVHDSIQTLPGATPARKIIVQRSQEYLDSLAQEASGDISLQRELATAYEKLGEVQGAASGSNLGDASGAIASFRKALIIRQSILASGHAQLNDRISLATTYRLLGFVLWIDTGAGREAQQSVTQAVTISEQAAENAPGDTAVQEELAADYTRLGDIQNGNGLRGSAAASGDGLKNHRRALAIWEQIAAASPHDSDRQFRVAFGKLGVADDLVKAGERAEALELYDRGREIMEPMAREGNNTVFVRLLTLFYSRIGDVLISDGKASQALRNYQEDFQLIQPLVAADPNDANLRQRLVGALASMGHAHMYAGHLQQARDLMAKASAQLETLPRNDSQVLSYRAFIAMSEGELAQRSGNLSAAVRNYLQALETYSALSAADTQDVDDQINLSEVHSHIGRAHLASGYVEKAKLDYQEAYAIGESLLSSQPGNTELLYAIAAAEVGLGRVNAASARKLGHSQEGIRLSNAARDWYQESLNTWRKIPNASHVTPNGFETDDPHQNIRRAGRG